MKSVLFILLVYSGSALACADFEGHWTGVCKRGDKTFRSETTILQNSCQSIKINRISYYVGKPTVEVRTSKNKKKSYKEVSVYNIRWNDDETILFLNLRWLGWYLNHPKTWSGGAAGSLKIKDGKLYSLRKFKKGTERCRYRLVESE